MRFGGELARNRRVQSSDRAFRDIQGLVTASMLPILALAKLVKPLISKLPEAKSLISDALTIMGQVQFNISIRRRYLMRPFLKSKYSSICNINTPLTSFLFGDDVSKEIKKCENVQKIGRFFPQQRFQSSFNRGRGFVQGSSGGRAGPMRARGRGFYRTRPYTLPPTGPYGQFGYQHQFINQTKPGRKATATETNPN